VFNTQNYWGSRLCPSSGILESRKYNVSEIGSPLIYTFKPLGSVLTPLMEPAVDPISLVPLFSSRFLHRGVRDVAVV
jgi:hypothetical protein